MGGSPLLSVQREQSCGCWSQVLNKNVRVCNLFALGVQTEHTLHLVRSYQKHPKGFKQKSHWITVTEKKNCSWAQGWWKSINTMQSSEHRAHAHHFTGFLTTLTLVKHSSKYPEKRSNSEGSVVEISKIHRVCLDKNSEDRLLYLMTGPGLPAFCDHWLCVVHFGEFMMV